MLTQARYMVTAARAAPLKEEVTVYYFVTDETNTEASTESKFFIYGGLVLSSDQFVAVHLAVEKIREGYEFQPGDELKFNTNTRPSHLDPSQQFMASRPDVEEAGSSALGDRSADLVSR